MVENLLRLREPATWIVIGVTTVSIVLAVVRFVLALTTGGSSFSAAAQDVALEAMPLTLVIALVALVISCVFHAPVAGARRLVVAAATVVTIGTVLTLLGSLLGLPASASALAVVLELLGGLLDIVLKVVGTVTLWLVHRGLSAGRIRVPSSTGTGVGTEPDAVAPAVPAADEAEETQPPPTWSPDAAAGGVWTSASDAASGAGPSAWGVPGSTSGWRAVGQPDHEAGQSPPEQEPRDPS